MTVSHADRRNAGQKERVYRLAGDEIEVFEGESVRKRIALDAVRQVRLSIEMAGPDSQIVCRITDAQGDETVFGSRAWTGVGQFEQRADTFSAFLTALHQALEPRWAEIRFLEGQSLAFMTTMFVLGLALAGLGFGFFVLLALMQGSFAGWALLPVGALGGWLAAMFRPRAPKTYDPAVYARPSRREQVAAEQAGA